MHILIAQGNLRWTMFLRDTVTYVDDEHPSTDNRRYRGSLCNIASQNEHYEILYLSHARSI